MEVGEVMASCEARLLKAKTISQPFTAKEIAEGALQEHLTQEDYNTPLKVEILTFNFSKTLLLPLAITNPNGHYSYFSHKISRDEPDCQPKSMLLRPWPGS